MKVNTIYPVLGLLMMLNFQASGQSDSLNIPKLTLTTSMNPLILVALQENTWDVGLEFKLTDHFSVQGLVGALYHSPFYNHNHRVSGQYGLLGLRYYPLKTGTGFFGVSYGMSHVARSTAAFFHTNVGGYFKFIEFDKYSQSANIVFGLNGALAGETRFPFEIYGAVGLEFRNTHFGSLTRYENYSIRYRRVGALYGEMPGRSMVPKILFGFRVGYVQLK